MSYKNIEGPAMEYVEKQSLLPSSSSSINTKRSSVSSMLSSSSSMMITRAHLSIAIVLFIGCLFIASTSSPTNVFRARLRSLHRWTEAEATIERMDLDDRFEMKKGAYLVHKNNNKNKNKNNINNVKESESFGALALEYVIPAYDSVTDRLSDITTTCTPDQVANLRKSLLNLRNILDIFASVYFPQTITINGNKEDVDEWRLIRSSLADGYVTIGEYQDLAHSGAEFNENDVNERRLKVIEWKSGHIELMNKINAKEYLSHPSFHQLYIVSQKKRHQSAFFWKACNKPPSEQLTGIENVALLVSQLLDNYSSRTNGVLAMNSILPFEVHEEYHNFRKSARAIINIDRIIPDVFTKEAEKDLLLLQQFYKRMGAVNDNWTQYNFYVTKNDNDSGDKSKTVVEDNWKSLKQWLIDTDIPALAQRLKNNLAN